MENKHIDKIAAPYDPDRREGSSHPRGVGAEPPHMDTGPQYEAKRRIGREGQVSGGVGGTEYPHYGKPFLYREK
jgi:hypothetical protein